MRRGEVVWALPCGRGRAALQVVRREDDAFGLELAHRDAGRLAGSATPVVLYVLGTAGIVREASAYRWLREEGSGIAAGGSLVASGCSVQVVDRIRPMPGAPGFVVCREIDVQGDSRRGIGFWSGLELEVDGNGNGLSWFAPGAWYHRNEHAPLYAVGRPRAGRAADGPWRGEEMASNLLREDRLAAPLFMCFDEARRIGIALLHLDARGQTVRDDDTRRVLVDPRLGFGALGERHMPGAVSLCFWYPGTEGDVSYPPMWTSPLGNRQADFPINPFEGRLVEPPEDGWSFRAHPLQAGMRQRYELALLWVDETTYAEAVHQVWRTACRVFRPRPCYVDLQRVRSASLEALAAYVTEAGEAVGIPTWVECFSGRTGRLQNTFRLGFVGRNVEAGRLLLAEGRARGDFRLVQQGLRIITFWATRSGLGLSHTEFDAPGRRWVDADPASAEPYVFLREQSEGHHDCLKAWVAEARLGVSHPEWMEWITSYARWLLAHQNPDGFFYRAYRLDGTPHDPFTADCAHVIPFLVDMAALTQESEYLRAACRTGEYLLENFHVTGRFAGATLDNPRCYDKEACIHALEAYLALYRATRALQWLRAAELAASFAETWTYIWEVPMPEDDPNRFYASTWTTVGLQLITTGFSAVDMYMGAHSRAFHDLACLTGDPHFAWMAQILHWNTKVAVYLGDAAKLPILCRYARPGLQIEHWGMGRGRGFGINSGWLPWVSVAHIADIDAWCEGSAPPDAHRAPSVRLSGRDPTL